MRAIDDPYEIVEVLEYRHRPGGQIEVSFLDEHGCFVWSYTNFVKIVE